MLCLISAGWALSGFSTLDFSHGQRSQVVSALSKGESVRFEHVSSTCQYVSVFSHGTNVSCEGDPSYERTISLISPVEIMSNKPFLTIIRFGESPRGRVVSQDGVIRIKNVIEKSELLFQDSNLITRTLSTGEATASGNEDVLVAVSLLWRTEDSSIMQTALFKASFEKRGDIGFSGNRMTASVGVVAERAVNELVHLGGLLETSLSNVPSFFDTFVKETHNTAAVILGIQSK
jgi:hypothetical protein